VLVYEGHSFRTYTSLCTIEDLETIESAKYPVTLQEAFVEKTDIRVGIIGNKIMATAIHLDGRQSDDPIVDFRHFWEKDMFSRRDIVRPEAHTLPPEVEERCFEFIRRCGLQYSMMDLLLVPGDEYVFLENNTHGMYGEVNAGGHDVMGAVADLLMNPEELKLV
jgi:D-alanine-D-alanine ligase-like ATP-grasp enzyme